MRFKLLILYIIIMWATAAEAQSQKMKFGKPSREELLMTEYENDKNAEAVFLYEANRIDYDVTSSGIFLIYVRELRLKILKEEGLAWVDIAHGYSAQQSTKENETDVKVCVTNIVNGKVVTGGLEDVKVGSIIDIKYKVRSSFVANIPSINFQYAIPVRYSYFAFGQPDFMDFSFSSRGILPLRMNTKEGISSVAGNMNYPYNIDVLFIEMENIPALQQTDHIYCLNDFTSGLDFKLKGIWLYDLINEDYAMSWPEFCSMLEKNERFGGIMKSKTPFVKEAAELKAAQITDQEKISQMMRYVQNRVKWNGQYTLLCSQKEMDAAIEEGIGSSASMNFLLLGALREMGYAVYPVLLNPRNMSCIPYGEPNPRKINTFILLVKGENAANYYIDASDANAFVNVIPPMLLTDNAHYFFTSGTPSPVNLFAIDKNQTVVQLDFSLSEDLSRLKGSTKQKYHNLNAYDNNVRYNNTASLDKYIAQIRQEQELTVLSDFQRETSETATITEEYNFEKTLSSEDIGSDRISLNPTLFMADLFPTFDLTDRKLPYEIDYPKSVTLVSKFTIPNGWEVEELPQQAKLTYQDDFISFSMKVSQSENVITTDMRYTIRSMVFIPEEFDELTKYIETQKKMTQQKVILKKSSF